MTRKVNVINLPEKKADTHNGYIQSASNPITYRINQIGRTPIEKIDTGTGIITKDPTATRGDMSITVPKEDIALLEKGLSPLEQMTLQYIQDVARKSDNREFILYSKDYAELRGIGDSSRFRNTIDNQLTRLLGPVIKIENQGSEFSDAFHILDRARRDHGKFFVTMGEPLFHAIKKGKYCNLPESAYKVNLETYPHAFALIKLLYDRKSMNYGNPGENTTSVLTALKVFTSLPNIDEVRGSKSRGITRRIVSPFTETVDYISEEFPQMGLEFCQANNAPLTDEQCDKYGAWDYETFISLYLKCTFTGYPTAGLEAVKKRRIKKAKRRIAAREKRAAKKDKTTE